MKICAWLMIFIWTILTAGCAPLPHDEPFDQQTLDFLREGSTTREEVLLTMGEPTLVERDDAVFLYYAERVTGVVLLGGGEIRSRYLYVIEFNESSIVAKHGPMDL